MKDGLGRVPAPPASGIDGSGIDGQLEAVRAGLDRLGPHRAAAALGEGAVLVDTRPEFQRRADGDIPGALVVERNHLEWRLDPRSGGALPEATGTDIRWIVVCDEGFASSLAAASLRAVGLHAATDLDGGFQAWRAAGLPVTPPGDPAPPRLAPSHSG